MTIDDMRGAGKVREGYWFVPKRFGYGATPVTWQGWAVTLGFVAAMLVAVRVLPSLFEKIIVAVALLAGLLVVCIAKTDGDLRWRSGRR